MGYHFYIRDMEIAKKAISDSKLNVAVKDLPLLCEVYCQTSIGHQSFYLQLFGGEHFVLLYAKPYYADRFGCRSVSGSFERILSADQHPAAKGDIYCGIQRLPKDEFTIRMLLQCLPKENEWIPWPSNMLDGVITIVRNHTVQPPCLLGFYGAEVIEKNAYSKEEKDFLDDLHLAVEAIIGDLKLN